MKEIKVFANMDKKLVKKGGRKSIKFSEEELKTKIVGTKIKNPNCDDIHYALSELIEYNSKINKDVLGKISFSTENLTFKEGEFNYTLPNIMGFHTLPNGFSFIGGLSGGDWEVPVFFIIYFDGKALRGYIPTYGNSFNNDLKCAFGSEGDSEKLSTVGMRKYKKITEALLGEKVDNDFFEEDFAYEEDLPLMVYLNSQGYSFSKKDKDEVCLNVDINEKAILEDIVNRIEVNPLEEELDLLFSYINNLVSNAEIDEVAILKQIEKTLKE